MRIPATRPDVAVLDVRPPDGSGVEVCREVRSADAGVRRLMLTSFADDEALSDAIAAGASGYVLKGHPGHRAAGGRCGRWPRAGRCGIRRRPRRCGAAAQRERLRGGSGRGQDELARPTEQERRILDLIGEGLTNRQIGARLHLAEKTIKNYVSGPLAELGMRRCARAAAYVA